jgi:cytochrome c peroxidase
MHDGRLYSLGQVLEHYRTGIQQSATLDSSLRKGIEFTPKEKYDLVLFLGTLTDTSFLKDKRFSQP